MYLDEDKTQRKFASVWVPYELKISVFLRSTSVKHEMLTLSSAGAQRSGRGCSEMTSAYFQHSLIDLAIGYRAAFSG